MSIRITSGRSRFASAIASLPSTASPTTSTSSSASSSARNLPQRLGARRLDRRQRLAGLFGLAVHQMQPDPGLDVDQRDVVRDDVVQLAGDPQPLVGRVAQQLLLAGTAGLHDALAPGTDAFADREQHEQPGGQADDRRRAGRRLPDHGAADPQRRHVAQAQHHDGQRPVPGHHGRDERGDQGEEDRAEWIVQQQVARRDGEDRDEHRRRAAAKSEQQRRGGDEQQVGARVERPRVGLVARGEVGPDHLDDADHRGQRRQALPGRSAPQRGDHHARTVGHGGGGGVVRGR